MWNNPPSLADYSIGVCAGRKLHPKAVITAASMPRPYGRGGFREIIYNGGGSGLHRRNTVTDFERIVKTAKKNHRQQLASPYLNAPWKRGEARKKYLEFPAAAYQR
jgi:hypothetical protein